MSKRTRPGRRTKCSPRCENCGSPFVAHVLQIVCEDGSFAVRSCASCWPALEAVAGQAAHEFGGELT